MDVVCRVDGSVIICIVCMYAYIPLVVEQAPKWLSLTSRRRCTGEGTVLRSASQWGVNRFLEILLTRWSPIQTGVSCRSRRDEQVIMDYGKAIAFDVENKNDTSGPATYRRCKQRRMWNRGGQWRRIRCFPGLVMP